MDKLSQMMRQEKWSLSEQNFLSIRDKDQGILVLNDRGLDTKFGKDAEVNISIQVTTEA